MVDLPLKEWLPLKVMADEPAFIRLIVPAREPAVPSKFWFFGE